GDRPHDEELIQRVINQGGKIIWMTEDEELKEIDQLIQSNIKLLDGLLGTGLQLPVQGKVKQVMAKVNKKIAELDSLPFVIAVDCPSGIDCDTGEASEYTISANLTVCMGAVKEGMLNFPAFGYLGKLTVVDIGIEKYSPFLNKVKSFLIDDNYVKQRLPIREKNSHKGAFGTAMIIAGCKSFPGAALLSGRAAYRTGLGLLNMVVPESVYKGLYPVFPESIWLPLPETSTGAIVSAAAEVIEDYLAHTSAILLGPGLGLEEETHRFVHAIIQNELPALVIDADGLRHMVSIDNWKSLLPEDTILTPHPGEMSAMTGLSIEDIQLDRLSIAKKYAIDWKKIIVLKGANTVIADSSGMAAVMPFSSSVLAKAGTGDVLAGIITGLYAQGVSGFEAAVCGVWLHAHAGKLAQKKIGSAAGVLAGDIIEFIPPILNINT
ncbi:MAG: NAD(P)H-hydrate dehydratase, partial [Chloroflexota bacterium]